MRCWHGYLSGAKCKWLAYGPADATAIPSSLLQKIQNGLSFWYRPTQVVLEKSAVKRLCMCVFRQWPSLQRLSDRAKDVTRMLSVGLYTIQNAILLFCIQDPGTGKEVHQKALSVRNLQRFLPYGLCSIVQQDVVLLLHLQKLQQLIRRQLKCYRRQLYHQSCMFQRPSILLRYLCIFSLLALKSLCEWSSALPSGIWWWTNKRWDQWVIRSHRICVAYRWGLLLRTFPWSVCWSVCLSVCLEWNY